MGIYSVWYHMDDANADLHVCHNNMAHDRFRGMSAAGKLPDYTFELWPSAEWLEGFGIQPEDLEVPDSHVIEVEPQPEPSKKYLHQILRDKIRATLK